jgi:hypothetical protein
MFNYIVMCSLQKLRIIKKMENTSICDNVLLSNLLSRLQLNYIMGVEGVAHKYTPIAVKYNSVILYTL